MLQPRQCAAPRSTRHAPLARLSSFVLPRATLSTRRDVRSTENHRAEVGGAARTVGAVCRGVIAAGARSSGRPRFSSPSSVDRGNAAVVSERGRLGRPLRPHAAISSRRGGLGAGEGKQAEGDRQTGTERVGGSAGRGRAETGWRWRRRGRQPQPQGDGLADGAGGHGPAAATIAAGQPAATTVGARGCDGRDCGPGDCHGRRIDGSSGESLCLLAVVWPHLGKGGGCESGGGRGLARAWRQRPWPQGRLRSRHVRHPLPRNALGGHGIGKEAVATDAWGNSGERRWGSYAHGADGRGSHGYGRRALGTASGGDSGGQGRGRGGGHTPRRRRLLLQPRGGRCHHGLLWVFSFGCGSSDDHDHVHGVRRQPHGRPQHRLRGTTGDDHAPGGGSHHCRAGGGGLAAGAAAAATPTVKMATAKELLKRLRPWRLLRMQRRQPRCLAVASPAMAVPASARGDGGGWQSPTVLARL